MMEENLLNKKLSKKINEFYNKKYDETNKWFSFN